MPNKMTLKFDGPIGEDNKPVLEFGFRGGASVYILVFGAKIEVHSGNSGNYAPNPLQKLARLVGNMKDDEGRVTIPGFYDAVKLDAPGHEHGPARNHYLHRNRRSILESIRRLRSALSSGTTPCASLHVSDRV